MKIYYIHKCKQSMEVRTMRKKTFSSKTKTKTKKGNYC